MLNVHVNSFLLLLQLIIPNLMYNNKVDILALYTR